VDCGFIIKYVIKLQQTKKYRKLKKLKANPNDCNSIRKNNIKCESEINNINITNVNEVILNHNEENVNFKDNSDHSDKSDVCSNDNINGSSTIQSYNFITFFKYKKQF
jgi:hypothetical protein